MSATSHDFKTWEADASKCSTEQLKNIIQDCKDAEIAMRSFNTWKENYYADQKWTYMKELKKRQKKSLELKGVL